MKYLHLIWAALFRRKTRTILTLVSIIAAFLLFGLLDAVRASFDQIGRSAAGAHRPQTPARPSLFSIVPPATGAQRLQTQARLSFIDTLPQALGAEIEAVPGVKAVAYSNWFGGAYKDPHNQIFTFAVSPNYLDLYPEIQVSPEQRQAFDSTLTGALAGEVLAQKYGWEEGGT